MYLGFKVDVSTVFEVGASSRPVPDLGAIKYQISTLQSLPIPEHADSFEEIHNKLNDSLTQVEGL